MDPIYTDISIQDCPICGGTGVLSEQNGWAFTVQCCDCGAETGAATYNRPEDRRKAAEQAAYTWNLGKVIHMGTGD